MGFHSTAYRRCPDLQVLAQPCSVACESSAPLLVALPEAPWQHRGHDLAKKGHKGMDRIAPISKGPRSPILLHLVLHHGTTCFTTHYQRGSTGCNPQHTHLGAAYVRVRVRKGTCLVVTRDASGAQWCPTRCRIPRAYANKNFAMQGPTVGSLSAQPPARTKISTGCPSGGPMGAGSPKRWPNGIVCCRARGWSTGCHIT